VYMPCSPFFVAICEDAQYKAYRYYSFAPRLKNKGFAPGGHLPLFSVFFFCLFCRNLRTFSSGQLSILSSGSRLHI